MVTHSPSSSVSPRLTVYRSRESASSSSPALSNGPSPPTPNSTSSTVSPPQRAGQYPTATAKSAPVAAAVNKKDTPLAPDILISTLSIVGGDLGSPAGELPLYNTKVNDNDKHPLHRPARADRTSSGPTTATSKRTLNHAHRSQTFPSVPLYERRPSAPISIPITPSIRIKRHGSTPSSPLSGREEKISYFPRPDGGVENPFLRSSSRTPSPKFKLSRQATNNMASAAGTRSPARSPLHSPSASRSSLRGTPKTSAPETAFSSQLPPHLASLPRYHPAVLAATSSARSSESSTTNSSSASTPSRQYSNAQLTLHAYQREMVAAAANASRAAAAAAGTTSPSRPRLEPLGSPTDVMTPLVLNESGGYIAAGARDRKS